MHIESWKTIWKVFVSVACYRDVRIVILLYHWGFKPSVKQLIKLGQPKLVTQFSWWLSFIFKNLKVRIKVCDDMSIVFKLSNTHISCFKKTDFWELFWAWWQYKIFNNILVHCALTKPFKKERSVRTLMLHNRSIFLHSLQGCIILWFIFFLILRFFWKVCLHFAVKDLGNNSDVYSTL